VRRFTAMRILYRVRRRKKRSRPTSRIRLAPRETEA
jgi:hypothetical protein